MLLGITVKPRPFTPPPRQVTAKGSFDFVNGIYTWENITLTAADIVDQTGFITANGLEIPLSGTSVELLHSDTKTFLGACQWTMVFDIEIIDADGSPTTYLFTETNAGEAFYIEVSFSAEWDLICSDGITNPFAFDDAHSISAGIHRFAVTQTDSAVSLSVDGSSAATDETGVTLPKLGFPMTKYFFGGYSSGTGAASNIRKVSIYEFVDNITLKSLSQ